MKYISNIIYFYSPLMKGILYTVFILLLACNAVSAQFSEAELEVAGLTCSLCSKSTENQLKKLDFVDSIHTDLSHATFILYFKKDKTVDFYRIKQKVEDAGFSIAIMKTTYRFDNFLINVNGHFNYQNAVFYCMNKTSQLLNGEVVLQIMDKGFISNKDYKERLKQWPVSSEKQGNGKVYHVAF